MSVKGWAGRKIIIRDPLGNPLAGVNAKSISFNRDGINVTADDEDGFQTMLGEPATVAFNMDVEGIMRSDPDNTDFVQRALDTGTELEEYTVEFPWGQQARGNFFFGNFSLNGPTGDAITFSASLQSSGVFVYEPTPT